jgi:hypothetical protein
MRTAPVKEHWTVTGHGLVLAGKPATIEKVAQSLHLPPDALVPITATRAALALSGDALARYKREVQAEAADLVTQAH